MNDLADRVASAKEHATPKWTPERERLVRARIDVRATLRRKLRRGFAVTLALATAVAAFLLWHRSPIHEARTAAVQSAAPTLLGLEDGSSVVAKTQNARLEPVEINPTAVSVRLLAGSAHFSVTPNPKRSFSVLARDVTVTVLGTVFSVSLEPGGVRVVVERGRVHVAWPAGERILALGEEAFIADAPAEQPAPVAEPASEAASNASADGDETQAGVAADVPGPAAPEAAASPPSPAVQKGTAPSAGAGANGTNGASWRALAQDGDYAGAYKRMAAERAGAVRDEPGDLLLAADVARLSGHPDKAIPPLQRVVGQYSNDSRAPLAAFTLGRTLLDQLGRPREAAAAFATARRLEPHGAMAQDALAREVESWSRAGEASLARERAEQYVSSYPKGRRLGAVRRLGGLE